ncbi:Heat induced stress protein YflT [Pirellula sp. SH-Sr6A]|uniref:hypothetical protein n=1 Tax=Pirellula sp. SH-Sr6A TaxID=1632865 RepID=UPI00078E6F77|nr:hypothetical protein [Pirellula sp. SH-Sr6A]AMV34494.1 Heat induced stress protein YflT [Pirellula sp. SH-Sr6A]
MNTVIGAFRTQAEAQTAVNELLAIGLDHNQIGVIAKRPSGDASRPINGVSPDDSTEGAAMGAATGAALGLGAGALWGLAVVAGMLPAIGPVIAGGTFAALLASAATGATAGGVVGALTGFGLSVEDAEHYEQELDSGRVVVTVRTDRVSEVQQILRKHGAYERNPVSA